ncbi:UDP-N-acetylmuramoyl-L-alanyl-D-glutamate--2,6-diaminopimelate ligase [Desulfovibrio sp. OttesenSCG-928-O18]|nr:UDP-N-acetylmuramoyl-L-alanyl-D-glutamate--2,6-diaminopimelate ligase [Desulfovibrio sp. OttesenSCG-928-O18]
MSAVKMIAFADLLALAGERKAAVVTHSGKAGSGDIFVTLPKAVPVGPSGPDYTGAEKFLADAVRAGASYVVCTEALLEAACPLLQGVSFQAALVPDTRAALGELASARYGTAAAKVRLLGITGTNGKTTSTYLLEAILRAAGHVPGVIGTVEYRWPGYREESPLTTPDCMTLHGMVAAMGAAGADIALMEVSSHAIEQNRIAGLNFGGALFTNLTQDHLDYHRDMEEYFAVKSRLFTNAPTGAALAANVDDPYGARLFDAVPGVLGFGFARKGERILFGELLEQSRDGLKLRMTCAGKSWELTSPLVGEFNAYNLLGAQALALAFGVDIAALGALETFCGVPGRLERIANDQGLSVFVDYSHTPDALRKALAALRGAKFSRIITVFGCGGNRDRAKRPLMGEAAAEFSDVVVLTSDNPRKEDPLAIMADARPGLVKARKIIEEADRKKAIGIALGELRPGDALLIAGKGHEPYQIIGDVKYPFSDQQVVREFLGCA